MRKSGILMHITSLPNPYGIGTMGKCAYDFVDFLCRAGQSYWQILPISPTGYGDSPYQALSTYAGNHYLIDLDVLVEAGLLMPQETRSVDWGADEGRVDFGKMYAHRLTLLRKAYDRFQDAEALQEFITRQASWLEDYALFVALKEKFQGMPWHQWPQELLMRCPSALDSAREELKDTIAFHCFVQYLFFQQWTALRSYANGKGIRIIGDVPIYVPLDSADVWAESEFFRLDENRRPQLVAGCPPDSFSADGQRWGNPLYNWDAMKQTNYNWWIRRLKSAAGMYDVVRLDHFRGFESYWAIPAADPTAAGGWWEKGPGMDFVSAVQQALPELDFIAEDLGFVTPEVRQLLQDSGYPGMKVLQFGFDSREAGDYLPHAYIENSVCYTGTHDNMTLKQWLEEAGAEDVAYATEYLGLNPQEGFVRGMIRGCMSSGSKLCVVQLQDYLELGSQARMNFPGTLTSSNWTWRAGADMITDTLADKICAITRLYGRL